MYIYIYCIFCTTVISIKRTIINASENLKKSLNINFQFKATIILKVQSFDRYSHTIIHTRSLIII